MKNFHSPPIQAFASLFPGRTDVWGALHGEAIKEQVLGSHYGLHLAGKVSLGIYPLKTDGNIRWCAIDIDKNQIELGITTVKCLGSMGMTSGVYLERSRRKGFHVLVLFSDWVAAPQARRVMKFALHQAGLPKTTEIFPKQDRLTSDTPFGSYLNLPYFGNYNPEGKRMILNLDTLAPIPLVDWLENVKTFPAGELSSLCSNLTSDTPDQPVMDEHKTGLQELLSSVHTTGSRRPALASIIGHLRSRGVAEEVVVLLVVPWAREQFDPVLPGAEVEKHIRGIYRRYGVALFPLGRRRTRVNLPTIEV